MLISAIEDPVTLWFKLRHRSLVSFGICRSLRQFSTTNQGREIRQIIDAGANVGQFAAMARFCWPQARIISYEPDPTAAAQFRKIHGKDSKIILHECALGDNPGVLSINYGESSAQNSALVETKASRRGTFQAVVRTLDDSLDKSNEKRFLKIDVQGYEMHVLRGAQAILKEVDYLLIEISLADMFEGGALVEEVWGFLRKNGFKYHHVMDLYFDSDHGVVMQMDVLFSR